MMADTMPSSFESPPASKVVKPSHLSPPAAMFERGRGPGPRHKSDDTEKPRRPPDTFQKRMAATIAGAGAAELYAAAIKTGSSPSSLRISRPSFVVDDGGAVWGSRRDSSRSLASQSSNASASSLSKSNRRGAAAGASVGGAGRRGSLERAYSYVGTLKGESDDSVHGDGTSDSDDGSMNRNRSLRLGTGRSSERGMACRDEGFCIASTARRRASDGGCIHAGSCGGGEGENESGNKTSLEMSKAQGQPRAIMDVERGEATPVPTVSSIDQDGGKDGNAARDAKNFSSHPSVSSLASIAILRDVHSGMMEDEIIAHEPEPMGWGNRPRERTVEQEREERAESGGGNGNGNGNGNGGVKGRAESEGEGKGNRGKAMRMIKAWGGRREKRRRKAKGGGGQRLAPAAVSPLTEAQDRGESDGGGNKNDEYDDGDDAAASGGGDGAGGNAKGNRDNLPSDHALMSKDGEFNRSYHLPAGLGKVSFPSPFRNESGGGRQQSNSKWLRILVLLLILLVVGLTTYYNTTEMPLADFYERAKTSAGISGIFLGNTWEDKGVGVGEVGGGDGGGAKMSAHNPDGGIDYTGHKPWVPEGTDMELDAHSFPLVLENTLLDVYGPGSVSPKGTRSVTPVFFHVPQGGLVVEKVLVGCWGLTSAFNAGGLLKGPAEALDVLVDDRTANKYVNVDVMTTDGVAHAAELGLADSGLVEVIITPHLHVAASSLLSTKHRGRLSALLRHPVDRAVATYHLLTSNPQSPAHNSKVAKLTLEQYASSPHMERNWLTRFLSEVGAGNNHPVTPLHARVAMEVLRKKTLVGLYEETEAFLRRMEIYYGWNRAGESEKAARCRRAAQSYEDALRKQLPTVFEGDATWNAIVRGNQFDMEVYEYAQTLWKEQDGLHYMAW